ncbi:MAG: TmcC family electron transfer complex membrane anchor subunit [Desulfovibrio aminophilus]|uniref:TmcC family electron transfer complex membrane anchor subunit n=1 Tax=Desulfovibrio aminophilus TaxID=81425 RepID=UPI0039E95BD7
MHEIYNLVTGPLAWLAWGIFIVGSIYRLAIMYILAKKKDGPSLAYMSWGFSLRSIINWLIPFNALGWRRNPVMTVATFAFHICLVLAPIFLLAHVALWDQFFGVEYPVFRENVTDIMSMIVVAGGLVFAGRRRFQKEVRYVTTCQDWLILVIAVLPFLTGILAYHQIFNYQTMVILHILTGEIMLAAIPFTRLSHMLFAVFTRAYMGSEFGGVRRVKDW